MADVTASDVGALFGSHKYRTLRQLATAKAATGVPDDSKLSSVLRRGRIMEPAIAAALEHDLGLAVQPVSHYLRLRDDAEPLLRIGATKDYQVFETAERLAEILGDAMPRAWAEHFGGLPLSLAVELKSVDYGVFESEWSSGPPLYHYAQAATQAFLGGDDGALIAVLTGKFLDLHVYPVVRSERFEGELCRRVVDFWRRFEAGDEQPVQAGDPAKSVFPESRPGAVVDLAALTEDPELDAAVSGAEEAALSVVDAAKSLRRPLASWADRLAMRAALKDAEKTSKAASAVLDEGLKMAIGEAERARVPGWKVAWKSGKNGRRLDVRKEKTKR